MAYELHILKTRLIEKRPKKIKEDMMARLWEIEREKIDSRTQEGMLIEIFGCFPLNDTVITLYSGKDKIKSDFYLNGNIMEAAIIETFGCVSLDKIIKLDMNKEREDASYRPYNELYDARVVGID